MSNNTFENKTALVCGSTQGIGFAIAQLLAERGCKLVLLARNEEKLQRAIQQLAGSGHQYLVADQSDVNSLKAVCEKITQLNIDILINNSGGPAAGPAHIADIVDYVKAFEQHLVSNQLMLQAVLPAMQAKKSGRIINIISTSVKQPLKGLGVSNTIRGAVANWAKTIATELAPFGITVNNVLPGATKTERLSSIISGKSTKTGVTIDEAEKEMIAEIPAGRFAEPKEIAEAACFLASDAAAYITGINLPVDGGRTLSL